MNIFCYSVIISMALLSCNNNTKTVLPATTDTAAVPLDTTAKRTSFFDKSGMDTTVSPGNNFFNYANGSWEKITTIPDDQSGWGSFFTLYRQNQTALHGILEDAVKANGAAGSIEQKVGDYYTAGMDTIALEKIGAAPLKEGLVQIDAITNYKDMMQLLAKMNAAGAGNDLINFYVDADDKNSSKYIPIFSQTALTLPEKGYYDRKDSASESARKAMVDYAKKLFMLSGVDSVAAQKNGTVILTLETAIAASHRTPAETRDPQKNYNKISLADLEKSEPNIMWDVFFKEMNTSADSVNVQQPGYYAALNKLLVSVPIDAWKTKLKFGYMMRNAGLLSKDFTDAAFAFNKIFSGQKTEQVRWKKIVSRVDAGLGDLAGQLYVKKYFTDAAKQRMDELVSNLQKAFAARIQKNEWMSDSTKEKATVKLNAFLKKIGYTSKWKKYDDATITKNDFFADAMSIRKHAIKESIDKIGKDVDRTEWSMTPPTVNAYYNATQNEIVFPAGILQFPFFDANADDAINYGGIGMVIGHEMTHGFDDQGSQYDEKGNLHTWWNKADVEKFKSKTAIVGKQYSAYTMFGNMHVNGQLTMGENIADIGGIAIAYDAFKLTKQGQGNEKIDGFTPDQRFFLGFAQIWRIKTRDESMRTRLLTDGHSPEMFRINGPLSNFDPFYAAFNVQPTDSMYVKPENRAHIW